MQKMASPFSLLALLPIPVEVTISLINGGWPTSAPGKYNSQEEYSFSILGCPMFACFWQTWDLARRTNLSLRVQAVVIVVGPISRKRREK